ncbi:hypothetical protein NDU88_001677 [Pleurodeles waltl]|uniref:Uncharacterized protein n=1 Tax=Pleurodeles waltl TaxID=8319 RepID=A0AAV7LM75_PLEWA|nr:hypothetical protein NDU88_001677 [Pleurodeles waltl]
MVSLTAETRSMRLDIAGFQSQVSGLDQRVTTVETQVASWTNSDQELLHLRSKLIDLEDRSRKNNVRLLGFLEGIEVCMLHHMQARQLLQAARMQGPFWSGTLEIRLTADFSKETAERRKAFLSLRTRLCHLDMKFGIFEPARMWITKNRESRNFYDPEDLRKFLEGLQDQTQSMDMMAQTPQDIRGLSSGAAHSASTSESGGRLTTDPQARRRDLERLTKSYDNRGQVLQAVGIHTQLSETNPALP